MNNTLVFFIYGLAFFSMGLAIFFEIDRAPSLANPSALRALALFGFVHGFHEWLEMFLDQSDWLIFSNPVTLDYIRIALLSVSFLALATFGVMVLRAGHPVKRGEMPFWAAAGVLYPLLVVALGFWSGIGHPDWLHHVDAAMRYFIAVPAALLAGLGLMKQSSVQNRAGEARISNSLVGAGLGFIVYSLTQMVVPAVDIFPANVFNTAVFQANIGFPVQIVRAVSAVFITLSLVYASNLLEKRRQAQLFKAERERIEALEQVRAELLERERMRQELTRAIVMAQEEERARIARELHDETSQTLTAFTFHLAVLRQMSPRNLKAREQLEYLQTLSRQMSQDIYRLVRDLRPAQLDDLGLIPALQYLIDEDEKRTGLKTSMQISGEKRRLEPLFETVLFRVAQESLTNVARHSGVLSARLCLIYEAAQVRLSVEDDGRGFDTNAVSAPSAGLGLAGIRERVESVGGILDVTSAPGAGARVEVRIPQPAPSRVGIIHKL